MVRDSIIHRNYTRIEEFLNARQSVFVLGPRGSGKTFYLSGLLQRADSMVLSLDLLERQSFDRYSRHPEVLGREVNSALERTERLVVFIDEVQRIPSILDEVHRLIERHKPRVTFLLTGSSARKLKRADANLLAGRALSVQFYPLGIDEFDYQLNESRALLYGTLPQVFLEEREVVRREFLLTYVETYLSEEISREAQVRNLPGFSRFLELVAAENGGPVNYRNIARAAGVTDVTVKDYFEILVDTLIAYRIPSWTYKIRGQLSKAPKFYLFDTGVINALTGELASELRPSTNRFGKLFENFVVTQLIQQLNKARSPLSFYHYREHGGREVELILQKNPHVPPFAIEIKSASTPTLDAIKHLVAFNKLYPEAKSLVICRTPNSYKIGAIEFCSLPEAVARLLGE
jgi:uncharacterized protein